MGIEKILSNKSLNQSVFFPRVYDISDLPHTFKIDCMDAILYCKYYEVENPSKTVILFYGNGECVEDYICMKFPHFFNYINCNLLLVEYRGYGISSGIPTVHSVMQDVHFIIKALDNVPLENIILFGRSIGFFSVIEGIKKFPQIGGIILNSCNACPEEVLIKYFNFDNIESKTMRRDISKYFDVERTLMNFKGKSLILQAQDDLLVPHTNAFLLDGYLNNKSEVKIFESGGHNGIISKNAIEYFKTIKSFLESFDNSLEKK